MGGRRVADSLELSPDDAGKANKPRGLGRELQWMVVCRGHCMDSAATYLLAIEVTPRFVLYYNAGADRFVKNDFHSATAFKSRRLAEAIRQQFGNHVDVVRFVLRRGRLVRQSPYRGSVGNRE